MLNHAELYLLIYSQTVFFFFFYANKISLMGQNITARLFRLRWLICLCFETVRFYFEVLN